MQAYFRWAKPCSCSLCCCSRHLWFYDSGRLGRVEIVTLKGKCEGERRKGGRGRGEKKYACPISLFFWETPYAGKRSSWLVRHREVDLCLSINCKSILFIPFPSVFWNWSGWECRVYYAMRKSKRFLHWSSGQDLLAVLKPTPLLPRAKMLLFPIRYFFSGE